MRVNIRQFKKISILDVLLLAKAVTHSPCATLGSSVQACLEMHPFALSVCHHVWKIDRVWWWI